MAKRVFHATNWNAAAIADATSFVNSQYMALRGGSSTQRIEVNEIMAEGLSSATASAILQLARDSTLATTATALAAPNSDGPMDPATATLAAAAVSHVAASSGNSARSNATTDARLELNINTYGGILRWNSGPDLKWIISGNTGVAGESSLSAYTGGAATAPISAHFIYEPL